jgi:cell division protease FtsH
MTDELGPLSYGEKDEQIFLGREISRHRDYSDNTAESIDILMRKTVEGQVERSRVILTDHRDQLDLLAKALLEHEMLDREEIMKVIAGGTLSSVKKTRSLVRNSDKEETPSDTSDSSKQNLAVAGEPSDNVKK